MGKPNYDIERIILMSNPKTDSSVVNKVVTFNKDTWKALQGMARELGTDESTLVNQACLDLSSLDVDDLIDALEREHQEKIARIKAQFS